MNTCRAIKHLLEVLSPHSTENGGPLKLDHAVFVEGRGNLIIEYSPEGASGTPLLYVIVVLHDLIIHACICILGTIAFVGSHLDVVPANPETWDRNPFELVVEVQNMLCCEYP